MLLLGASHGGWAVAELMALAEAGTIPPGLTAWPEPPDDVLSRVAGVVLLYPYCGRASGAAGGWNQPAPVLMLLAGEDEIVSVEACQATARALAAHGVPVEVLVMQGAGHGFDQRARAPASPLSFDARATDRALALGRRFARTALDGAAPFGSARPED